MGYKENYEAYINLSRKELQGLCKKHKLPANKPQSELAKSLASYFKKRNSSIVSTGEATTKEKPQDKTNEDHNKNENQHGKRLDAEVGNEQREASPILIESSEEDINIEKNIERTIDGIIDNLYPSTSEQVPRDQDLKSRSPTNRQEPAPSLELSLNDINLKSQSPTMRREPTPPLEHSSKDINLKSKSPTKSQNQEADPTCTCHDKNTTGLGAESSTVTETDTKPVSSFEFFVSSEERINLFVDLNSGPSDWFESLKDGIFMNPETGGGSISSFLKGTNSSLSSVLGENIQSETAPIESSHNLSDVPAQIEKNLDGIEEGEKIGEMEFSETVEGGIKEVCEISTSGPDLLVPCQNSDKVVGEEPDPLTEVPSVAEPADKVVVLDSATADSVLSSSERLGDVSVPKPRDSSESTPYKNLKRVLNRVSGELSPNKKNCVVEESNISRNFTKILRSSRTLVNEAQQDSVSPQPRRSPRLVSQ